jgi:hypothetical protein
MHNAATATLMATLEGIVISYVVSGFSRRQPDEDSPLKADTTYVDEPGA